MYQRIIVGIDGSDRSMAAVEHAAELAAAAGAELHLVQGCGSPIVVASMHGEIATVDSREVADSVAATLEPVREDLRSRGLTVATHVRAEGGADALLHVAESVGADLIVVGNRGMTGLGRVLGSVPNTVAHHAPCAVLIVPTD
jgi:nucleotide-binding universal stress UspA family protein